MEDYNNTIHDLALSRLSAIFDMPVTALKPDIQFGIDLNCSFVSYIHNNEFDLVDHDIHDVVDDIGNSDITKELRSGRIIIWTVDDYCKLMIRCSKIDFQCVKSLLEKRPTKIPSAKLVIVETIVETILAMFIVVYFVSTQRYFIVNTPHLIHKFALLAFLTFPVIWIIAGGLIKDIFNKKIRHLKSRNG